jgi:HAD superfamily hydrolase (TIGR01450 family)
MMTSGDVAISFLQRERPGKSVFLLGTPSLRTQFRQAGIPLVEPVAGWAPSRDNPVADIVMVAFDTTLAYDALSQACWHIREGAEFLATHPDWNCPVEGGFIPDCGAMCALVEASTGRKPRFLGKPYPETMAAVLERTGAVRAQVAFVGDRLYTDVATGVNNGASGILVLTGEAGEADIVASEVKPTWVYPSLKELGEALGQPEDKKTQGQPEDKKAQGGAGA